MRKSNEGLCLNVKKCLYEGVIIQTEFYGHKHEV